MATITSRQQFKDYCLRRLGFPVISINVDDDQVEDRINDAIQYHLGVLLLDLKNPKKILYRSEEPIFGPKEKYELSGIVDIIPGAMNLLEQGKRHELKQLLKEATAKGFMPQVTFTTAAPGLRSIVPE